MCVLRTEPLILLQNKENTKRNEEKCQFTLYSMEEKNAVTQSLYDQYSLKRTHEPSYTRIYISEEQAK